VSKHIFITWHAIHNGILKCPKKEIDKKVYCSSQYLVPYVNHWLNFILTFYLMVGYLSTIMGNKWKKTCKYYFIFQKSFRHTFVEDKFHLVICPPSTLKTICQCFARLKASIVNILNNKFKVFFQWEMVGF